MGTDTTSRGRSVEGLPTVDEVSPEARMAVREVMPDGIAAELDLRPGDLIESIDGYPIRDAIDYRFHASGDEIEVTVRRDEQLLVYEIEKDADEDLGVVLEDMPILKCDNKCVFCFLHQMPKGMRKSLYYQDDDYRLSFLHGAYVTLTNLSEEEMGRIVSQRLSPMYISVHATDPEARGQLLGRPGPIGVLDRIAYLGDHGIQMHAQVVLCPGINDEEILKQTVFDLAEHHPRMESVGIVPLGMTKYRKNLPDLDPVTEADANRCLDLVKEWQDAFRERLGTRFVFAGDEFYLQTGRRIPAMEQYDGFPLLENGVGMVRRFSDLFDERFGELGGVDASRTAVITSVLSAGFIRDLIGRLQNGSPKVVEVRNRFFGDGISVTGLLTGSDIVAALQSHPDGQFDKVLLPPNCVSFDGIFLDDMTPDQMSGTVGCPVTVGSYDLVESLLATDSHLPPHVHPAEAQQHPYLSARQVSE